MKLGLIFVLLLGCGGGASAQPTHPQASPTPGAKEQICHALIEQGVTLYASEAADSEGIPAEKGPRAIWRELYKEKLQEQNALSEGFNWCMDHVVKHYDDIECAAGALHVAEFEQCLGMR